MQKKLYTGSEEAEETPGPSASETDVERAQERRERKMMRAAEEHSGWIPGTPIPLHEEDRLRAVGLWPWVPPTTKRRRLYRKTPADQWKS